MDEKQRLLNTLFRKKKERTLNIKFFRGFAEDISTDDFCKEVNSALMQIRTEVAIKSDSFSEDFHKVDATELASSL